MNFDVRIKRQIRKVPIITILIIRAWNMLINAKVTAYCSRGPTKVRQEPKIFAGAFYIKRRRPTPTLMVQAGIVLLLRGTWISRRWLRNGVVQASAKYSTLPGSERYESQVYNEVRPVQSILVDLATAITKHNRSNDDLSKSQHNPDSFTRSWTLLTKGVRMPCPLLHMWSS